MEVLLLVNKEDIEVSNLYVMYLYYMFCLNSVKSVGEFCSGW